MVTELMLEQVKAHTSWIEARDNSPEPTNPLPAITDSIVLELEELIKDCPFRVKSSDLNELVIFWTLNDGFNGNHNHDCTKVQLRYDCNYWCANEIINHLTSNYSELKEVVNA